MIDANDNEYGLDPIDRDALQSAMKIAGRDELRLEQLQGMLQERPWRDVAEFAAYCVQMESLRLRPWRDPPMHADEDHPDPRDPDAQELLRRMLEAGISRFEPDPLAALAKAQKK